MADEVTEGLLPVGTTLKNLDTTIVEQTDGTPAHREAVVIADPVDNDARVSLVAVDGEYKVPVVDSAGNLHAQTAQEELLQKIVGELKVMNFHLSNMTGICEITPEDLYGDEL